MPGASEFALAGLDVRITPMAAKTIKTLTLSNRGGWRTWLRKHHESESEIWVIFQKRSVGRQPLSYDDAVEEALCFGWIDSIVRRIDDVSYVRKFTPRKADSQWSPTNRRRYASLEESGLLEPAGARRAPTGRSSAVPPPAGVPGYAERRIRAKPAAWRFFQQLAPSYRRAFVGWIDSAKRPETKDRRLREALELLANGKKLGLK